MRAAEWSFGTSEPDEDAGGRAVFAEESPDGAKPYLLPTEGLFWRRTGHDQYLQRYERYEGWLVAPGDSVPFLPTREISGAEDSTSARLAPPRAVH